MEQATPPKKNKVKKTIIGLTAFGVGLLTTVYTAKYFALNGNRKNNDNSSSATQQSQSIDNSSTTASSSQHKIVKLDAPVAFFDDAESMLKWESVVDADYYLVDIDGKRKNVDECEIKLNFEEIGDYDLKVKAISSDSTNFIDSDWSNTVSYKKEDPEIIAYRKVCQDITNYMTSWLAIGITSIHAVDYKDGTLTFLLEGLLLYKTKSYQQYFIDMNNVCSVKNVSNISQLAEITGKIKDTTSKDINGKSLGGDGFGSPDYQLYDKVIRDSMLNGKVKDYMNSGYSIQKIFSGTSVARGSSVFGMKEIRVPSFVKLSKGGDVKYVMVDWHVLQESVSSLNDYEFHQAYLDNTGKNIRLKEEFVYEFGQINNLYKQLQAKDNNNIQSQSVILNNSAIKNVNTFFSPEM